MGSLEYGAMQAVENCIQVKPAEGVVIITDDASLEIGKALEYACEKITDNIDFYIIENFGERPLKFPREIGTSLRKADASFYAAQGVEGELDGFRTPMLKIVDANKKLRHAHMIGITKALMETGMSVDYQEVQRVSKLVYDKVKDAKEIRVLTELGTDFTVRLSKTFKWEIGDGNILPEKWQNLPSGEVSTYPHNINGKAIIDGCLGDFFIKKYGTIENTPLELEIENGRVKKDGVICKNKELEKEFSKHIFETDENSNRIGEFALGTNIGLKKLIGILLQDEKFPGVHIAMGCYSPEKRSRRYSKIHVDGVIKNTTVFVDEEKIMENGEYLIL